MLPVSSEIVTLQWQEKQASGSGKIIAGIGKMQKCEKDGVQQNRQPDTILFEPVAHYISPTKQFLEHRLNRIAEKEKCQPQQV